MSNCPYQTASTEERKNVLITIRRDELLSDIRTLAYTEGHVMSRESEASRSTTADVGDNWNTDVITREMNHLIDDAREMLREWTKTDVVTQEWTNRLEEPSIYEIKLSVGEKATEGALARIRDLIHDYVVYGVLWKWLSITNPTASEKWGLLMQDAGMQMKSIAMRTGAAMRRKTRPF